MNDPYTDVKRHFESNPEVTVNQGKGAQGIKYGKKMFMMFYKGQILVQFSPERVTELIQNGEALPYDPGTGKPMKDRVIIPDQTRWIEFCEESLEYTKTKHS